MIYFGENQNYIFAECEQCKREIHIDKNQITDQTSYNIKTETPVKCSCASLSDTVRKDVQSAYSVKSKLALLVDLLQKKQNIENEVDRINSELNYKFKKPPYFSIITKDLLFSLKIFLIILGMALGLELLLFIICVIVFFCGVGFNMPDVSRLGNELLFKGNIFKKYGVGILKPFKIFSPVPDLTRLESSDAGSELILNYLPYAIAGILYIVFVIGVIALVVRFAITLIRIGYHTSLVISKKIKVNQVKDEQLQVLYNLNIRLQDINEQISETDILPVRYHRLKDAEIICSYFVDNRVDTIRDALNLYQSEMYYNKIIDYQKAIYNEVRITKKYTKALYILTSDENVNVEVKEDVYDIDKYKMSDIIKDTVGKIKNKNKKISSPKPAPASIAAREMNTELVDLLGRKSENSDNTNNDGKK